MCFQHWIHIFYNLFLYYTQFTISQHIDIIWQTKIFSIDNLTTSTSTSLPQTTHRQFAALHFDCSQSRQHSWLRTNRLRHPVLFYHELCARKTTIRSATTLDGTCCLLDLFERDRHPWTTQSKVPVCHRLCSWGWLVRFLVQQCRWDVLWCGVAGVVLEINKLCKWY